MDDLLDANCDPLLADDIVADLANSKNWKEVTPEEAQALADEGKLVIVAGPGHVATVRPRDVPGDSPPPSSTCPLINNIGRKVGVVGLNYAFKKGVATKFYTPK